MQEWEYKFHAPIGVDKVQGLLDLLAEEGWELATVIVTSTDKSGFASSFGLFFKRQKS